MVFGRVLGWLLLGLAAFMASADAVLALGAGDETGIAAGEVLMLISGQEPFGEPGGSALSRLGTAVMDLPAWAMLGPVGLTLCWGCRKRRRRLRRGLA